jgi:hypothetical protein
VDSPDHQPYEAPRVEDYGTLEELTEDASLLSPLGLGAMAAVTGPLTPPGGPGGGGHGPETATPPTVAGEFDQTPGDQGGGAPGDVGGEGGGGGGDVGGGGGDVGGESGGGGAGGGESGKLPFTGFPVVLAGAVGGVMTAAGAKLRRAVSRSD